VSHTDPAAITAVDGEKIPDSFIRIFITFVGGFFLMVPLGGGLVWAWWTEFSFAGRQISWWGALIGVVLFLLGVLCLPTFFYALFHRRHIILGEDRLQVVVGQQKVDEQIPFKNITRWS